MLKIRRVISALTSPFRPDQPVEPLRDWNLNPFIHPLEASHGYAGHLVDLQGRDFIDLLSAWGANILGYNYPCVSQAIAAQAQRFMGLGVPYPEFHELGQMLCDIIPCADLVRYGKNGSDATMGAVRLARAITQREHILHHGYHGFHDWWMAGTSCRGIPESQRGLIHNLPELIPDAVDAAFRVDPEGIACLILDPIQPPIIAAEAIAEIAEIVHRHGALLIFDEVVSGFRVAPGGMQELWDVTPDLACYGKAIANGMPLSVLTGKGDYMRRLPEVNYGMTFEGEALSISAGIATVREIVEKDVCGELGRKGRRIKEEYARLAGKCGVKSCIEGMDARPYLKFEDQGGVSERELRWLLIQEMAKANVLMVGTISLCYSHDEKDMNEILAAFAQAMPVVGKAIEQGSSKRLLDERIRRSIG